MELYSISGGRTQVDGTVYEISFSKPLTITVSGGSGGYAWVTYNGAEMTSGEITITAGESVTVDCFSRNGKICCIYLNGNLVASAGGCAEYEYTPSANATIKFTSRYASGWKDKKKRTTIKTKNVGEEMTLSQIIGGSSAGIVLLLTLIEIAPIKVNPWSALFSAIGRRINKEVLDEITELKKNMKEIRDVNDERNAKECRSRILHFGDELYHDARHTKEHFDQILDDIHEYSQYCESHKDFKNDKTVLTTAKIRDTYRQCVDKHSFL